MTTSHFQVTGMTCGHCQAAVRDEVSAVKGVTGVDVDLESGRLTVHSADAVDATAVIAAVDEAGYAAVASS